MIKAIIKGIFALIMALFTAIVSPVVNVILGLVPNLSNAFNIVTNYINYCLTYVPGILRLCLCDHNTLVFLFDYFIICNTIYYSILGVRFAIKTYNKLKV